MRNNSSGTAAFLILIAAVVSFLIWKFGQFFNLDFNTSAEVTGYIVLVFAAWWSLNYFLDGSFVIWPIALGFFCLAWCPALDYWAYGDLSPYAQRYNFSNTTPWFAEWYFKVSLFVLPTSFGYLIHSKFMSR